MTILVTGGAGFIGSTFVHMMRWQRSDYHVVIADALTYAGSCTNLTDAGPGVFVQADIRDGRAMDGLVYMYKIDTIVNFAAETHVDRSIASAAPFMETNVGGTLNLLEVARARGVKRFLQVSTDEVYGSLGPTGVFDESSPIAPRSPYAASKAAADHFVMAFHHTHGLDTVIVRSANNYGPRQFPEKLIPRMILNALDRKPLPVYGDGLQVRDWIHVEDACAAILLTLERGVAGEVYNVSANNERPNLDVVRTILKLTHRGAGLIEHVTDRLGHDRRYAMNASKVRALGWRPTRDFDQGLADTVMWYRSRYRAPGA